MVEAGVAAEKSMSPETRRSKDQTEKEQERQHQRPPGRQSLTVGTVSRNYENHGAKAFDGRAVAAGAKEQEFLLLLQRKRMKHLPKQAYGWMAFIVPAKK
jgi:hypothetical protein